MRCPACGNEYYGIVHECSSAGLQEAEPSAPPAGSGPFYYLREAFAIARWDDDAVQRAARDNWALVYGLIFWAIAFMLGLMRSAVEATLSGRPVPWAVMIAAIVVILPALAVFTLVYYGICHLLARLLFGATGSYIALLRALMLGSVVQWAGVIPVVGGLIAGLWGLGVFMYVLSEVDGIERMQAVVMSIGLGIGFIVIAYFLASAVMPH